MVEYDSGELKANTMPAHGAARRQDSQVATHVAVRPGRARIAPKQAGMQREIGPSHEPAKNPGKKRLTRPDGHVTSMWRRPLAFVGNQHRERGKGATAAAQRTFLAAAIAAMLAREHPKRAAQGP